MFPWQLELLFLKPKDNVNLNKFMNSPETIFFIIIGILVLNFVKDKVLDSLNASRFNSDLPTELENIYDESEYQKSQNYKSTNFKFGLFSSIFSFVITPGILIARPGPGKGCLDIIS